MNKHILRKKYDWAEDLVLNILVLVYYKLNKILSIFTVVRNDYISIEVKEFYIIK